MADTTVDMMNMQSALTSQQTAFYCQITKAPTRLWLQAKRRLPAVCCSEWKTTGHVPRRTVLGRGGALRSLIASKGASAQQTCRPEKGVAFDAGSCACGAVLCSAQPNAYQLYFAANMHAFSPEYDQLIGPIKAELFSQLFASGDIRDVVEVQGSAETLWRCKQVLRTHCRTHL